MSLSKRVFPGKSLVCLATLLAPISSAYAATPPLDTDPNQGISRTSHDISDRADAASGSLNPALLRDTSRWQLSLLGYQGANSAALASTILRAFALTCGLPDRTRATVDLLIPQAVAMSWRVVRSRMSFPTSWENKQASAIVFS